MARYSKVVPVLKKHHAMKKYVGVEIQIHEFLSLALDGDQWSVS
jgi:hypothetical protein